MFLNWWWFQTKTLGTTGCLCEVTDGLVTWNVLSWSGGHEFKRQPGWTWGAWYFCPKSYLNQTYLCLQSLQQPVPLELMQKETHWQVGLQSLLAESTCVNQDVHQASWHCLNSKLVNTVHSSPYLMQSTMGSCYEWQAYDNGRHTIIIPSYLKQLQQDAYSVNVWHPKGCKSSRVMSKYIEVFFKLK